ncbi:MAG TPA: TIGR03936 family radical SAM-associated protein [Fervidobacterium sp.]|nr:TIGR03936 family radical SAM-associated protein [Fervidobacterium sp.]HOM73768.1 TIGR03936 family radical SAM-associated protein [Fervidobacterium sp.]
MQLIIQFKKKGMVRFLSAIETSNVVLRTLKRTNLKMEYSQGFHPAPRVSFLDSTPTDVIDLVLYVAVKVKEFQFTCDEFLQNLRLLTVKGMEPCKVFVNDQNLNTLVTGYEYVVFFREKPDFSRPLEKHSGKMVVPRDLINMVDEISKRDYYVVKYTIDKGNIFNPFLFENTYLAVRTKAFVGNTELNAILETKAE